MDTVYGTGRVDVVAIDDLVHADFTAALRGSPLSMLSRK